MKPDKPERPTMQRGFPTPQRDKSGEWVGANSSYPRRLIVSLILIVAIALIGGFGYHLIEGWPLMDGLFMTVITLTTIGYGEIHPLSPTGRVFTMALIVSSLSVAGYAFANLTGFILEGELNHFIWGLRMKRQIEELKDHIILCGGGRTGRHTALEFYKAGTPFVVIERDPEIIQQLLQSMNALLYLQMDATEDESLILAGVKRARGLVAALAEDKDNVFVVLSARALNPNLRIVARLLEDQNADKLRKAGADAFVSASVIGGYRLASEMLRPLVVDFVEQMHRGTEELLRLEKFPVETNGPVAGRTLGELNLGRCTGILVIATRPKEGGFRFNPGATTRLKEGDTLIAMGTPEQMDSLHHFLQCELPD